jgi:HD-GYP domain-containing protein (c-di-GMP phosphodiesterase class II)
MVAPVQRRWLYTASLAAALWLGLGGVSAHSAITNTAVAFVVGAALIMYGLNILLVSTAIALSSRRSVMTIFVNTHHAVGLQFASLYLCRRRAASPRFASPWVGFLPCPAVLAYHSSMKRRIQLTRETVRAVERMADEVDARDPYTFEHSQRVATYSKAIGRELGLSAAEIELVELSAKVHDIGKIRIPDSILLKPDRLTDAERRVMETHPRLGFEILAQFSAYECSSWFSPPERYGGRGYPQQWEAAAVARSSRWRFRSTP